MEVLLQSTELPLPDLAEFWSIQESCSPVLQPKAPDAWIRQIEKLLQKLDLKISPKQEIPEQPCAHSNDDAPYQKNVDFELRDESTHISDDTRRNLCLGNLDSIN